MANKPNANNVVNAERVTASEVLARLSSQLKKNIASSIPMPIPATAQIN